MKVIFVDVLESFEIDSEFIVREFSSRGFGRDGVHVANVAYPHLEGLPKFKGLAGPFPDRDGARYETWPAFELLSA